MSAVATDSTVVVPAFAYHGPEDLRATTVAALSQVIDPEVAMSIVDVGLVYGVDVRGTKLHVLLTMTSAACPVADVIIDDIWIELSRVMPTWLECDIELVWEPPWTPDRMTDRARKIMGW